MHAWVQRTPWRAQVLAFLAPVSLVLAGIEPFAPPHGPSDAFVHLFEWSWDDVAQECEDWLGPKGFAAVQVSPPTEHIQGPEWWTRYQPVSYNLTSRSGGEAAFASMVARCRTAGVAVYVDAVINHCAAGSGVGIAGSRYGGRRFPLFGPEDFHHKEGDPSANCIVDDYRDKHNVQYCDLLGMPDLCTECSHAQEVVAAYLNNLADVGVAGIRVDAAKHQDASDLSQLLGKVNASLFRFAEVIEGEDEAVYAEPYTSFTAVTEFRYGQDLTMALEGKTAMDWLKSFGEDGKPIWQTVGP